METTRGEAAPDHEIPADVIEFGNSFHRHVKGRLLRKILLPIQHVFHYADDHVFLLVFIRTMGETLAERTLAWPASSRQCLVDHHSLLPGNAVLFSQKTSGNQRKPQGAENIAAANSDPA